MHLYSAFGILIESEIELPELLAGERGGPADVTVCRAELAPMEADGMIAFGRTRAEEESIQFEVGGVGTFRVEGGVRISFDAEKAVAEEVIRLYLLGSGLGAILMQRGLLVLHGSVVVAKGKAVAFLGESGVGKSTLATALVRGGFPLLSDDLCVVSLEEEELWVQSGYPQNKLWLDSLAALDVEGEHLRKIRPGFGKRALKVDRADFCSRACLLERIYTLSRSETGDLELSRLAGPAKLAALLACVYRPQFVNGMGLASRQFEQLSTVARNVSVDILARSEERFALDEVVSRVLGDLGLISG